MTVRARSLHLDAPHGSFEVLGISDEVKRVVDALPDGTGVECEGSFDGGGTILHLYITKVRRILKDLSGRVMQLPDAVIAADPRLAGARARVHFEAGRIDDAARDVGYLLALGDDGALGELERLPLDRQLALRPQIVEWQANRRATWRALRHVPIEQWTDPQLEQAVEQGLVNGGVFGSAPGVRAEALLEELERRKRPAKGLAKQTQKLRRAQATEGDTFFRITPELADARVVGADVAGVFLSGTTATGHVVALVSQEGRELQRWPDIWADRVVEGVALQMESKEPRAIRLADRKVLFEFANRIEHHDGELVWGVHERDPKTRTMRSEIRHIATGFSIAVFDRWVDRVLWNAQHVFVYGASPRTLTREGRLVREEAPALPTTIDIETATGRQSIPALHAPWRFGAWHTHDAGGWMIQYKDRQLYLAASEPDALWFSLELAQSPTLIELAPPWLAIHHTSQPILLVALAEAVSAQEIRVDGKRFARRSRVQPNLAVAAAFAPWYAALVTAGVVPARSDIERDALLFRLFGAEPAPTAKSLARVLAEGSPCYVEHADYFVDADDGLYAQLNVALATDGIRIEELERITNETALDSDDDDEAAEHTLVLQISRGTRAIRRRAPATVDAVVVTVDKLLDELGATRRFYAILGLPSHKRGFLALAKEQRAVLVAANVEGIRSSARAN